MNAKKIRFWIFSHRPVFYALLGKLWGVLSSPITMVCISFYFTPKLQGYYYTFLSLVALQVFLELSFTTVIINFAAHEWSFLNLNGRRDIEGDAPSLSRLSHLFQFSQRWYMMLAGLFAVFVGSGGYFFLFSKHDSTVSWQGPWWILVVLAGLQLCLLPFQGILEGCNQIASMAVIRMVASMVSNCSLWIALMLGFGLWSLCLSTGLNVLVQASMIVIRYRHFFLRLHQTHISVPIAWVKEVLPVQWRLAAGGIVSYFATSLFTPVMFWYHGAAIAGQMGMGWQMMIAAQAIALTWVQVNVPTFGLLVARREFEKLDRLFFRVLIISSGVLILACAAGLSLVKIVSVFYPAFSARFMPLHPLMLFFASAVAFHLPQCQAAYLRAHKREPLLGISVFSSLVIGGVVWFFGKKFALMGAGAAYLGAAALITVPAMSWIWITCRREWHKPI